MLILKHGACVDQLTKEIESLWPQLMLKELWTHCSVLFYRGCFVFAVFGFVRGVLLLAGFLSCFCWSLGIGKTNQLVFY